MTELTRDLLRDAAAGDREAEARLLQENSGLIWSIARRYYGRGVEPDDLYQLAAVGFIKAVRGFDLELGTQFSTYAVPKIAGEIRRFLRDDGAVKVSRAMKERSAKLHRIETELTAKTGNSPTISEIAEAAGLTPEEVAACEQSNVTVDSFERELSGGGHLSDLIGDDGLEERACLYLSLREAIRTLPERDQEVLALRFSRDLTQQQVAKLIGVSQVQVSRIEKRAIAHLRGQLTDSG
ncbi:sigma-70 family RNA polymerase sigma factor [Butyricicoccus faecihominis]|uniref:sigma-70 family RNA polymerase sigma factor n=1 Tax=Butyricicoccaceae TaxID=3085642 RepID=UPI002478659F|nr:MULTISPECIES: sigma-70 family RNA polymerase sigma factor [Butyricicoccaceae]MCQ5130562.1 sigma-70 family RNA polymerase sigma factor [Butyricicoccus faecihominis]WNX83959.1 sigma-70 family RNA polymerase sigma factor [Agathobaculum sp. NTUH-O15-33]